MSNRLRLGLIGDNIRASRAPELHRHAGRLCGIEVSYERYVPADLGLDFDGTFAKCLADGLAGFNVTLPYKEKAAAKCRMEDPVIARIGAVNTVRLGAEGPQGFNTDYTGFIAAYRSFFDGAAPGEVVVIGAGGVGRAVAFGLVELGAKAIRLVDRDLAKAQALVWALRGVAGPNCEITAHDDAVAVMPGTDGVVNCTPLGMVGYDGSPLADTAFDGQRWGFDAVYTPVDTEFRAQAGRAGIATMSGFELFFHQGVHAFEIFSGRALVDKAGLRHALDAPIGQR